MNSISTSPRSLNGKRRWRAIEAAACLAAAAMVGAAGCAQAPRGEPDLPPTPAAFRETDPRWVNAIASRTPPAGEWWKIFADTELEVLIGAALRENTSIQLAAARLAKARSVLGAAEANRMPQANASLGVNQQGGPLINAAGGSGTLWTLAGSASYEADLFGKLGKEVDAATLDAASREALLRGARLLVEADVAQNYFALRLLDAERAVVRESLAAYEETLRLTERRFELGSVAELDVARLRVDADSAQAEALALDRRRAELEHALALLLGQVASNFSLEESRARNEGWLVTPPVIPPGLPATMLVRRPDVAAAQRTMLAAQARLGIAQSAWFPNVTLTTQQGFASTTWRDLLAVSARAWGAGLLLSLPLFDGGRREAATQGAAADLEAAVASYREQILTAFKEVEDQLSGLKFLADQARAQERAATAARRATVLATSRYNSGLGSQLELLDTRRNELRSQRQAMQVRLLQYQATVALVRALGGAWDTAPAPASTPVANPVTEGAENIEDASAAPDSGKRQ